MYLVFSFISFSITGQSIKGTIKDSADVSSPFISVALLQAKDSSIVKGTISNEKGEYEFQKIKAGTYLVKAVATGYIDTYSSTFDLDSSKTVYEIPTIKLFSNAINLNEVAVTVVKPIVEFKEGMIVMNVENSPLVAGNTAFDLLKRLPGVYVDAQNNILLNGKGGVRFLLDGRIQRMNQQQIVSLLMSMSAETISKMEIMTNPPVKYDAEGTGGMINIVTKKVKVTGFSGNVSGGFSFGKAYRGGIDAGLNYKGKKFTFTSSFGWGDRTFRNDYIFDKTVVFNGNTTFLHEPAYMTDLQNYINARAGLDINISKRGILGVVVNASYNNTPHTDRGNNYVSGYNDVGFSYYKFDMNENNRWIYPNYTVYFEQKIDTLGSTLNVSLNAIDYSQLKNILSTNTFHDDQGNEVLDPNVYKAGHDSKVKVVAPQIDLKKKFRKGFVLETGLKSTLTESTNEYKFSRQDTNKVFILDTSVSNSYLYDEIILAGYLNFKKEFKYTAFQIGARGENTNVDAINKANNFRLMLNYFKIFPNVSFSYNKNPDHIFQISFSSRIMRPNYPDLNPFKSYQDNYSYTIGNPKLLPQMMYQANINYSIKNTFHNTLTYSYFDKPVISIDIQDDSTKETISQMRNFNGHNYYYGYMLFMQKQWKKINLTLSTQFFYNHFESEIDGAKVENALLTYLAFTNVDLILPKNFKLAVNANYFGPTVWGTNRNAEKWRLDIGIRKSFMQDKLSFFVNMADIFYSDINRSVSKFGTTNTYFKTKNDTQRLQLSMSYRFGKVRVQKRELNNEEGSRIKSAK